MKFLTALTASLTMAFLMTGASASAPAIYVNHDKVAHAFGKRGPDNDGQIASAPVRVVGNYRSGPGEAEVHEKEIDVLYVMEGGSTLVTGGTLVGGKPAGPGQMRGTGIQGGRSQRVSKGDVIIVPAGTPHWHKEVPQSITYYTVKVPK